MQAPYTTLKKNAKKNAACLCLYLCKRYIPRKKRKRKIRDTHAPTALARVYNYICVLILLYVCPQNIFFGGVPAALWSIPTCHLPPHSNIYIYIYWHSAGIIFFFAFCRPAALWCIPTCLASCSLHSTHTHSPSGRSFSQQTCRSSSRLLLCVCSYQELV
jgi:hypothetical protein